MTHGVAHKIVYKISFLSDFQRERERERVKERCKRVSWCKVPLCASVMGSNTISIPVSGFQAMKSCLIIDYSPLNYRVLFQKERKKLIPA
jgi:hypothetical protein